ncbi:uncharacterized protein BT62DRAFT_937175 [Guyanagaster necrorhizus]|uniref:F-box domain-containing protein n=1 Tax=Guyanagaster necrorhizus TaxID=856835 RepID=A0A9P7VIU5_9AGAR|nr:uncharacterized protein BT62DRAFT_937175 [Guyanagaster necrorhizus MCA 3950]KAG7441407.1 hypothetical protein BT62DRAFT_937175 [Guyanagaster necrorhizus MCA 3950]
MAQAYHRQISAETFPSVTLNNLPNELLLLIFQGLDPFSLIGVSCLCRRINAVALTYLLFPKTDYSDALAKLRANTLSFGLSNGLSFNSIAGVRLSFSMKHPIEFFSCHFSTKGCIREMEQVARLFETGKMMECVDFRFPRGSFFFPDLKTSTTGCELNNAAVDLLFRNLHRTKCRSFGTYDVLPVEYDDGARFSGPVLRTLKYITISRTPFLLTDFFREWTISTMNTSPLRDVTLEDVDIQSLLPVLSLPSLQKLDIRCLDLPLSDITRFLARHPTIESLMLRISFDAEASLAPNSLPQLKDFSSTAECLSQLLSSPGSMPRLQSVTCYISTSFLPPLPLPTDAIQTLFRRIALHSTITILDVPLSDLNVSEEWMSVNPRFEHLLTTVNSLYVTLSMSAKDDSGVRHRIIKSIALFPKLETLTLFGWAQCEEFASSIKEAYPRLRRIFSGLTDISRSLA